MKLIDRSRTALMTIVTVATFVVSLAAGAAGSNTLIATCWMQEGDTQPFTGRMWSPWSFERRVEHLAKAGFHGMGLFTIDLRHILQTEAPGDSRDERLQWMHKVLESNGIHTVEIEYLTHWMLPKDDYRRKNAESDRELVLHAAKVLEAHDIKVGNIYGYPVPKNKLKKRFGNLCKEAQQKAPGTTIGMEILPVDPNSKTIDQAWAWVKGHENCALFFDTWHVNHISGITYDDISQLNADQIAGVELDDGFTDINDPTIGFIQNTVDLRRVPGYGDFDMVGFVKALRKAGYDGPWGNEILSKEFRELPMDTAYPRVYKATTQLLKKATIEQ